jgi:hypothetical protein
MVSAATSNRSRGMTLFGNTTPVIGSRGLLADAEKSPARSSAVGMIALLR